MLKVAKSEIKASFFQYGISKNEFQNFHVISLEAHFDADFRYKKIISKFSFFGLGEGLKVRGGTPRAPKRSYSNMVMLYIIGKEIER